MEPDTPTAHYDSRTHQHAEQEINPLDNAKVDTGRSTSREMNSNGNAGLAGRRGEKSLFLDGLSRLQSIGSGGKGKGKGAQYRLGSSDPIVSLADPGSSGLINDIQVYRTAHGCSSLSFLALSSSPSSSSVSARPSPMPTKSGTYNLADTYGSQHRHTHIPIP